MHIYSKTLSYFGEIDTEVECVFGRGPMQLMQKRFHLMKECDGVK